jgi:hypothetical protein
MIRIFGSSSVICPNLPKNASYASILKSSFPGNEIHLFTKTRCTTEILMNHLDAETTSKKQFFNILHFRADEWLQIDEKQQSNFFVRTCLSLYLEPKIKLSKLRGIKYPFHFLFKVLLYRADKLRTLVSREDQLLHYDRFLEINERNNILNIVIIDTRIRFISPLIENIERSRRSIILKSYLGRYSRSITLDYADLGIGRRHFQKDRLHLDNVGNQIVADAIKVLIQYNLHT